MGMKLEEDCNLIILIKNTLFIGDRETEYFSDPIVLQAIC